MNLAEEVERRAEQAHMWWLKGLVGLLNIGEQIMQYFPLPRNDMLQDSLNRLQKFSGARYSINNEMLITDHQTGCISRNGGQTWVKVEGS
jgi:hypothetical protein